MSKLFAFVAASAFFISGAVSAETLTNETVVTLVKAGLGDATVIAKINGSAITFDLSTEQLIALKRQGVSNAVIEAMIGVPAKTQITTTVPFSSDSPNPTEPHASGLYVLKSWASPPKMEVIQPQTANYAKFSKKGFIASSMTFGMLQVKSSVSFLGEKGAVSSSLRRPEFYFYFESAATNLSTMTQAARTPDDFTLMKFTVKKGSRSVYAGKGNAFGERGLLREDGIKVVTQKIGDASYKLQPEQDLEPGEYGFVIVAEKGGTGNSMLAYSFTVN